MTDPAPEIPVAIIVVNYRTAALVVDCLASIEAQAAGNPPRTIIVDNASPTDDVNRLELALAERGWLGWVELIAAPRNGGFAWGNNVGIARALTTAPTPRYLHLLNPDTIVRPGAIDELVRFLDASPRVGIAGSRLEGADGVPQRSAFRWPTPLGEFESAARNRLVSRALARHVVAPPVRDDPHPSDWVSGASLMVRREVIRDVGPLDDRYFMYYEEVEFCRRAHQAGWSRWYVPSSRVVHLVGQASGIVHGTPKRRPAYWFDSRRRYFITQFGRPGAILADLAWLAGDPIYHFRRLFSRRPSEDPQRFLRDIVARGALSKGLTA